MGSCKAHLWAYVACSHGEALPESVTLVYRAGDPYSVELCLGQGVQWALPREILRDDLACTTPPIAGGDASWSWEPEGLLVTLRGQLATGEWDESRILLPRDSVEPFARSVFDLVPVGGESQFIDWSSLAAPGKR